MRSYSHFGNQWVSAGALVATAPNAGSPPSCSANPTGFDRSERSHWIEAAIGLKRICPTSIPPFQGICGNGAAAKMTVVRVR
jgi:hypothetical protein